MVSDMCMNPTDHNAKCFFLWQYAPVCSIGTFSSECKKYSQNTLKLSDRTSGVLPPFFLQRSPDNVISTSNMFTTHAIQHALPFQ